MAVLEEHSSVGRLASIKHEELRDLVEAVSFTYKPDDTFIFGWSPSLHLMNGFTIHSISQLPALVAINSTSHEYILIDGQVLPQDLIQLLDNIRSGTATFQGGNGYWPSAKRKVFDVISTVAEMYRGNPVLTVLLFGLPMTFFLFIMYSIFFSDFVDAPDDEEEEEEGEDKIQSFILFLFCHSDDQTYLSCNDCSITSFLTLSFEFVFAFTFPVHSCSNYSSLLFVLTELLANHEKRE